MSSEAKFFTVKAKRKLNELHRATKESIPALIETAICDLYNKISSGNENETVDDTGDGHTGVEKVIKKITQEETGGVSSLKSEWINTLKRKKELNREAKTLDAKMADIEKQLEGKGFVRKRKKRKASYTASRNGTKAPLAASNSSFGFASASH